ncbi:MAG: HDIG domain-containing protein [Actinobacteria bacterium]|nr:HDIG domain-containing protein [Actinomycetota bacterium]
MDSLVRRYWALRLLIAATVVVGVPTMLSIPAFLDEAPIEAGQASPRTVVAPQTVRVDDDEATERARRQARESVSPVLDFDPSALSEIVSEVRDDFEAVRAVRQPTAGSTPGDPTPGVEEQIAALQEQLGFLSEEGLRLLVTMDDRTLTRVRDETVDIAQTFARQRVREDQVEQFLDDNLPVELAVRDFSGEVADQVVAPIIRNAMRPTVIVDEAATESARQEAASNVQQVQRTFPTGTAIVTAGEEVTEAQLTALQRLGLAGSNPRWELLRALGIVLVVMVVVGAYLRAYRGKLWRSNRRLLLLAVLVFAYAIVLGASAIAIQRSDVFLYGVPAGALAMLATILLGPPIGVLMAIPVTLLTAYIAPDAPGVIAFAGSASLLSVPFVTRLSSRGDLRRGTVVASVGYVVLAGTFAAVFDGVEAVPRALLAGAVHGVSTAVIVLGGLPFIETAFGIITATGLVDLADRNHPLLRELERKALGSYNHSIMVSTLVERACRAIGADALLGSVCALYHDIGKVQRPYFFVENQFGIANPHDELDPEVSAIIIQRHVSDGVEMGRRFHLPPEVVEGIATHHGTTLVTYFYLQAVRSARSGDDIEEGHFRYKGRKPSTRETAVLMLADCCEAAARAAAQHDRNLTDSQLEDIVEGLFADRIDDGQLDQSPLTFKDLATVKRSFIETLVGVYHPRIAYPGKDGSIRAASSRS